MGAESSMIYAVRQHDFPALLDSSLSTVYSVLCMAGVVEGASAGLFTVCSSPRWEAPQRDKYRGRAEEKGASQGPPGPAWYGCVKECMS